MEELDRAFESFRTGYFLPNLVCQFRNIAGVGGACKGNGTPAITWADNIEKPFFSRLRGLIVLVIHNCHHLQDVALNILDEGSIWNHCSVAPFVGSIGKGSRKAENREPQNGY